MQGSDIRANFLEFFRNREHTVMPSDLLVPKSDPTLLFTSAGMVQFKAHFMGLASDGLSRAATCQKCFRTSDIEEVGDLTHHTFFEMLGNFSFGDYFKRESIRWGWEYCTEVLKIPVEDLWITIYEQDDEAGDIWDKEIGVARDRIIPMGKEGNWWGPAGETGPCGPCSEIHVDRGPAFNSPGIENTIHDGGDRYVEIWNHVFTQFDQQEDGCLVELPRKNIDTGAGLDRIAMISQGVNSTFETDLIRPVLKVAEEIAGKTYGDDAAMDISLRVLADHGRATAFCIADGVMPGNIGRNYVLRRVIRRAVRHGQRLGIDGLFLGKLAEATCDIMSVAYPDLSARLDYIKKIELSEENAFARTLNRGIEIFDEIAAEVRKSGKREIPGSEIFRLYDTYGFPADSTAEIAEEMGLSSDMAGFETEMEQQRQRARSSWKGSGAEDYDDIPAEILSSPTVFLGYDDLQADDCEVLAILVDRHAVDELDAGKEAEIILDRTPFYAESGGQVGDIGVICIGEDVCFEVSDTQKTDLDVYLHKGTMKKGTLRKRDRVVGCVDDAQRKSTMAHHSATHLMQAALRGVLGEHVQQSGSKVSPDMLRFDFTHFESLSKEQLGDIEARVNAWIWDNLPISCEEMDIEKAKEIGALALFGEKYGERVRVVRMGDASMEFCGGTHMTRTGDIGLYHILREYSISAGNRRIEAVTRNSAFQQLAADSRRFQGLAEALRCKAGEQEESVLRLNERTKELEKENATLKSRLLKDVLSGIAQSAKKIEDVTVIIEKVDGADSAALNDAMDGLRDRLKSAIIVLSAEYNGKALFLCTVSDDLLPRALHAGNLIRELAKLAGGGGGGRPNRAQAGGKNPARIGDALQLAEKLIRETLKEKRDGS
jgi:alanyl-tRNA synthetase